MKLYFSTGACSFSPHTALREAGIDFALVRVDLRRRQTADGGDFCAINPKGYVPVLELDDGRRLTEVPAIVQYIADLKPESGLAPKAGSFARYQLQEWLGFISSEVHKSFSPLFRPTTPEEYKTTTRENLANRFAYLDRHLQANDFLMGNQFTVADGYLYTVLNWATPMGIDLAQWPALAAFHARVGSRPSVAAAQAAEAKA